VGIRRGKQTVYIRQSSLDSATFAHLLDRADVLITDLDRKGMAEIGATLDRIHRGYRTDQQKSDFRDATVGIASEKVIEATRAAR
jgi:hypothetical protein